MTGQSPLPRTEIHIETFLRVNMMIVISIVLPILV